MSLVTLACIFAALLLGFRIGIVYANVENRRRELRYNVLVEECKAVYEDLLWHENLVSLAKQAIVNADAEGYLEFMKKLEEYDDS